MADVAAAREHVQKAIAFLVNRFGHESDVFGHLTKALDNLKDDPAAPEPVNEEPAPETEPAVEPEPEPVTTTSPEPPKEAAPKPARRRARRKTR